MRELYSRWPKYYFRKRIVYLIIAPLSDIRIFYIRYLKMLIMHLHASAIRQLLYGSAHVRKIIHSLKLVDYLHVHTHKPYNNLHLSITLLYS